MQQKPNFKQSFSDWNSEFSFSETGWHTKVKESSQPYYLPIVKRRGIKFIPLQRVLGLCEMQIISSRI